METALIIAGAALLVSVGTRKDHTATPTEERNTPKSAAQKAAEDVDAVVDAGSKLLSELKRIFGK